MKTNDLIESFLNGNIIATKPALARRSYSVLVHGYADLTGCSNAKAAAFADFIKGSISFQTYCDTNHQPARE